MDMKHIVSTALLVVVLLSERCNTIKLTKCYGDAYSAPPAVECKAPTSLRIVTRVEYGVSMCAGQSTCCPEAGEICTLSVNEDAHLLVLKAQCDGKQRCPSELTAGRRLLAHCGGYSDFIEVTYDCVINPSTTPETTPTTTSMNTTTVTPPTITPTTTMPSSSSSLNGFYLRIACMVFLSKYLW